MLRSGYAVVEYLSISKVMMSHRNKCDRAYFLSETDENDITYFVNFNLDMVKEAANMFLGYVQRKIFKNEVRFVDPRISNLSDRQRDVLSDLIDSVESVDVYQLAVKHMT